MGILENRYVHLLIYTKDKRSDIGGTIGIRGTREWY